MWDSAQGGSPDIICREIWIKVMFPMDFDNGLKTFRSVEALRRVEGDL